MKTSLKGLSKTEHCQLVMMTQISVYTSCGKRKRKQICPSKCNYSTIHSLIYHYCLQHDWWEKNCLNFELVSNIGWIGDLNSTGEWLMDMKLNVNIWTVLEETASWMKAETRFIRRTEPSRLQCEATLWRELITGEITAVCVRICVRVQQSC